MKEQQAVIMSSNYTFMMYYCPFKAGPFKVHAQGYEKIVSFHV